MRRALLGIVLTAFFTWASAYPGPDVTVNSANTTTRATLQPVSSNVDVTVPKSVKQLSEHSADDASGKDDSDWRSYGTLFATLVLMAAIAVRRQSL